MNIKNKKSLLGIICFLIISQFLWGCYNDSSLNAGNVHSEQSSNSKNFSNTYESSSSESVSGEDGILLDRRDGQTYKTIVIGTQTWMAENLNYKVDSSWCYNKKTTNCAKSGRLYQWSSVMNISAQYNKYKWGGSDSGYQGLCADGWHLPNNREWRKLKSFVDANNGDEGVGTSLRTTSGWWSSGNGSDEFGFSAYGGGYRHSDANYTGYGDFAYFWSATEYSSTDSYFWMPGYTDDGLYGFVDGDKSSARSVRCLKN